MKKLILLLSIISLFCQSTFAQTGGLNFQGVARNATGAVLANQKINLRFSILKTTETGTVEYTETKEVTTNAQGIFAVVVGEVNATSFAAVDWKVTPKFLKVEMDAAGGTSFVAMGTTRLQNVPYAYYANGVNANNIDGAVPVNKGGTGAINAAGARSNIGAESIANKSTDLVADATSTTKYPSVKVIKDYVDTKVASGNISGTIIAISTGGTGATTASAALSNLGGESTANKSTDINADAASLTKYPSVKSIKDYVDTRVASGSASGTIAIEKGGTGASTAGAALTNLGGESIANKSINITADANSLTKYPSVKTIKDYIDTRISSSVTTNTSTNVLTHYAGELFGGGIVVSVWKEAGVEHGLIASMVDLSNSIYGGNIPGTNPTHSPSDGQAYTNEIIAIPGNNDTNCAANLCDSYINQNYGTGVFSDWYLPSFIELKEIYNNSLILHNVLGISMAPKFQPANGSPFIGIYHSSTYLYNSRLSLSFFEGEIKPQNNSFLCSVRAVRRF